MLREASIQHSRQSHCFKTLVNNTTSLMQRCSGPQWYWEWKQRFTVTPSTLWPLLLWPHRSPWWLPCQLCWEWTVEGKCGRGQSLRDYITNSSMSQWLTAAPSVSWLWGWQCGLDCEGQSCCFSLGSLVNLGTNNTSLVVLLLDSGWVLAGRMEWLISESHGSAGWPRQLFKRWLGGSPGS